MEMSYGSSTPFVFSDVQNKPVERGVTVENKNGIENLKKSGRYRKAAMNLRNKRASLWIVICASISHQELFFEQKRYGVVGVVKL